MAGGPAQPRGGGGGRAGLALALALVLFAFSFPVNKVAVDGFDVGMSSAVRLVLAAAFLSAVAWRSLPGARPYLRPLLLIGAFGMGVQTIAITAGIDAGTASLGALVLGLEPIAISLLAAVAIGERPPLPAIVALGMGLLGVTVVSGVLSSGFEADSVAAIGYLLITVAAFSSYTVGVRRYAQLAPPFAVSAVTMVGAAVITLPLAAYELIEGTAVSSDFSWQTLAASLYLGIGSTGVAYLCFSYVLARISAATFAIALYLLPVMGVLASWLMLGERPNARDVVGGTIILARGLGGGARPPRGPGRPARALDE